MNKEYSVSTEDKIIVSTDDGMVVRENSNNIDEILVKENLLEFIEEKIKSLSLKQEKIIKRKIEHKILAIVCPLEIIVLSTLFFKFFLEIFGNMEIINTIVTNLNYVMCLASGMVLSYHYNGYRKKSNEEKGLTNDIDYLTKTYEIEKSKLSELENEKTNNASIEEINKVKSVNDIETLEKLKKDLILYYNCGYEEKKYRKLQEKDKLKQKLEQEKKYAKEEIDKLIEILDETEKIKTKGQKRK